MWAMEYGAGRGRWWIERHFADTFPDLALSILKNQALSPVHQLLFWGKASEGPTRACRGRWGDSNQNPHRPLNGLIVLF